MSRRVAVVVVHGVADQERCSSARAAADLLRNASAEWADFVEDEIRVKVEEVKLRQESPAFDKLIKRWDVSFGKGKDAASKHWIEHWKANRFWQWPINLPITELWESFSNAAKEENARQKNAEEESRGKEVQLDATARAWWRQTPVLTAEKDDPADVYMETQLGKWKPKGPEATYRATRLRSAHHLSGTKADVFEMYWADLSRLESAVWRPFVEAFQLLFYVASLGRWTVEQERIPEDAGRAWPWFVRMQALAEILLVQFVPMLNVIELVAVLSLIALVRVPQSLMAPVLAGLAASVPLALVAWTRRSGNSKSWVRKLPIAAMTGGVAAWWLTVNLPGSETPLVFTYTVLAVGLAAAGWIAAAYAKRFPGAFASFWIVTVLSVLSMWVFPFGPIMDPIPDTVIPNTASAAAIIWLFVYRLQTMLSGVWVGLLLATGLSLAFGAVFLRRHSRRARAVWTGWATLLLSLLLVSCMNIAVWQLAQKFTSTVAPEFRSAPGVSTLKTLSLRAETPAKELAGWERFVRNVKYPDSVLSRIPQSNPGVANGVAVRWVPVGDVWDVVMAASAVGPLIAGAFVAIAAVMAFWGLLPAVMAELGNMGNDRQKDSIWLGISLSVGFQNMKRTAYILIAGFLVIVGASLLQAAAHWGLVTMSWMPPTVDWIEKNALHWTAAFGVIAGALLLGKGPLASIGIAFRRVLDVVLDVMNWMRLHPLEDNVRARICGRYASLLRHLVNEGDYHEIIILAHSQGTVITADLLRFLQKDPRRANDTGLGAMRDIPLTVFSMGCPLRQLYSERFPTQYGWVRREKWTESLLGVRRWVNAYTAGDYVGRNLWPGTADKLWMPVDDAVLYVRGGAREFCIGEGAHLGYWSPDQVAIREVLDALVLGTAKGEAMAQTP